MNARFWIFINGSHAKITLKPGQMLTWARSERTDEGWSSECESWKLCGRRVMRSYETDGVDCDGRLSHSQLDSCLIVDLKAREGYLEHGYRYGEFYETYGPGLPMPEWESHCKSQRDYSAEAMGY